MTTAGIQALTEKEKETLRLLVSGYDPVTEQAWTQWQKKQGRSNAGVVPVPSAALRHGAPAGMSRDSHVRCGERWGVMARAKTWM